MYRLDNSFPCSWHLAYAYMPGSILSHIISPCNPMCFITIVVKREREALNWIFQCSKQSFVTKGIMLSLKVITGSLTLGCLGANCYCSIMKAHAFIFGLPNIPCGGQGYYTSMVSDPHHLPKGTSLCLKVQCSLDRILSQMTVHQSLSLIQCECGLLTIPMYVCLCKCVHLDTQSLASGF
jgi:hypothetical protein